MEKLEELLETFEKEKVEKLKSDVWKNDTISPRIWTESDITIYNKLRVISKEFGFIKWLVDNDKIDFEKDKYGMIFYESGNQKFLSSEDEIIMELSIQDNPIEFLCSILIGN